MSSITIIQKSKLTPLNLTSQTVHNFLKQAPKQSPSMTKMYPTAKYATQQIRSATDINTKIIKKIKQLQKISSEKKKPRERGQICKTQVNHSHSQQHSKQLQFQLNKNSLQFKSTQQLQKDSKGKQEIIQFKLLGKQQQKSESKNSAKVYFQKINKIKNMKLRLYMKNKFAIQVKTIQTERINQIILEKETSNQIKRQNQKSLFLPIHRKIFSRHPKNNYKNERFSNKLQKSNEMHLNQQQGQKVNDEDHKQSQALKQKDEKNNQMLSYKLQRIMRKTQKLQNTHLLQKNFGFTRQFEDHPADLRFQRMINQLNAILYSYGCLFYIQKPIPSYSRNCFKYKYFVGSGNNKNLIISLMKRRWWWTQTTNINQAHFVWTQLKQFQVLELCSKSNNNNIQFCQDLKRVQRTTANPQIKKIKNDQQKQTSFFHQQLNIILNQDLQYKSDMNKKLKTSKAPAKVHNHYQGNSMLGNKKALFHFVSQYCQFKKLNRYDYIPLTFHIIEQNSDEMRAFEQAFTQHQNSYWIVKPGENSNRGNGIFVTNNISQIKQKVSNLSSSTLIVQKYISNLFLYKARKFDIRAYMIAVTIGGSTKFYWHSQGYFRTSSYIYNLKNHENLFIHLTNDAIQSTGQNYGRFEQGNKLSYQQFQKYLDKNYKKKNYSIKHAHQQMKKIAKMAVHATYPQINPSKVQYCFEVFGLDFIIDNNFKPWLIQINTNPCLELSSTVLSRLIPQMLQNTLRVALDPMYFPCVEYPRTMCSNIPDNILMTNRFSVIFDDFFDRQPDWEALSTQKSIRLSQAQQQEEVFQGDGQIIQNL